MTHKMQTNTRLHAFLAGLGFWVSASGAVSSDLDDFKLYFGSLTNAIECIWKVEVGTNVWFTRAIYENDSFLVRSENTQRRLSAKRFDSETRIAARHQGRYWVYLPKANRMLLTVDDKSLNDTNNQALGGAKGAYNATMAVAVAGLRCVFLGLPISDSRTISWSGNEMSAVAAPHKNLSASILESEQGKPRRIEVRLTPMAGHPGTPSTNLLVYHYDAAPVDPARPFVPNWIEFQDSQGGTPWKLSIQRWMAHPRISADTWDYTNYLNSSVIAVRSFTDSQDRRWSYDDAKEGFRTFWNLRVPNKLMSLLFIALVVCLPAIAVVATKILLARAREKRKQKQIE